MSEQTQRRSPLPLHLAILAGVAVTISGNFTNYGGIQSALHTDLQTTDQTVGLLSTLLYLGIAGGYVAGGLLVDRFGPRRVLIAALLIMGVGNGELSLMPELTRVLLCRLLIGIGAGIAIVAGSQTAARLPGRAAPLGQGLFGGAMQIGAGIGLLVSPLLLSLLVEWEWIFALWGTLALMLAWFCQCLPQEASTQATPQSTPTSIGQRLLAAFRQKQLVLLGLLHFGTLGMGQAVAPWLAVFFGSALFHLSIPVAAGLGACGLWLGAITRPAGGLLLTHPAWRSHLLRLSGMLAWMGLLVLVYCPTALLLLFAGQAPPVAHVLVSLLGLLLAVAGWTLPYSSVFSHADRIGHKLSLGRGTAQSVTMLLSAPASAFGPTVIGWLHAHAANFPSIFAILAWIQLGVLLIAWMLEPSFVRAESRSARTRTRRLSSQGGAQQTWASA